MTPFATSGVSKLWRWRRLAHGRWQRVIRWEFWPPWFFYPPLILWLFRLGVRYRGLTVFTAANPAMPSSGFIGESKLDILRAVGDPDRQIAPFADLPGGAYAATRLEPLHAFMRDRGVDWPVVLKPDVGQRGIGVAVVRSAAEATAYLHAMPVRIVAQAYVPGEEFGLFYVRHPDESRGRIISVTEKRMVVVTGDGRSTLERRILADPRAAMLAPQHLRRHAGRLGWVPGAGERVPLTDLGTHCRGALFLDGIDVVTPELEEAVDRLAQSYPGFHFGRMDVRAPSRTDIRAGRFQVLEINGVTSEATHIYDPAHSLAQAHRDLRRQWELAFAIGAAHRARGAAVTPLRTLLRMALAYRRHHAPEAPEAGPVQRPGQG